MHDKHLNNVKHALSIMLSFFSPNIQDNQLEGQALIDHQLKIFQGHDRRDWYETSKGLFNWKIEKAAKVGPHMLKMIRLIETVRSCGKFLAGDLAIKFVLMPISNSYAQFTER